MLVRDENDDIVSDIVESRGPFDGSTAVGLVDPCDCTLDVQTTGVWSVTVDQPDTLTGASLPTTLRGNGQAASSGFQTAGGLTRFHVVLQERTGGHVTVLAANGEVLDVLAESDVTVDRASTFELDAGTYLLQVDTRGPRTGAISAASGPQ